MSATLLCTARSIHGDGCEQGRSPEPADRGLHLLLAAWVCQLERTRHGTGTQHDKGNGGRCDKTGTGKERLTGCGECGVWSDDEAMSEVLEIMCGYPLTNQARYTPDAEHDTPTSGGRYGQRILELRGSLCL